MTKREELENWAHDDSTTAAIVEMLERLIENDEIRFRDGRPYWTSCGNFVGDEE